MTSIEMAHVGLCVSDLQVAMRFWCDGLGFEPAEGYDLGDELSALLEVGPGITLRSQMIRSGTTTVELLCWTTPPAVGTPPPVRNHRGLTHLTFRVTDLPAVEARLVANGGTVIESTRTHFDLGTATLDLLFVADPDGTRVELMETIARPG